jgi:polyribonucleotide nucleotidyltransferase
MNKSISKARDDLKANKPIVKKFDVSAAQRGRFVGVGGMNLKKIYARTGVTIAPIDETYFSLFAPNKDALDEAEEMMKSMLEQPVNEYWQ